MVQCLCGLHSKEFSNLSYVDKTGKLTKYNAGIDHPTLAWCILAHFCITT